MSQRKEKYARSLERRADKLEESRDRIGRKQGEYGRRLQKIETDMSHTRAMHDNEMGVRQRGEVHVVRENRRQRREIERKQAHQGVIILLAMALDVAAIIVAVKGAGTKQPEAATAQPTTVTATMAEVDRLTTAPAEFDPQAFPALYRAAEDPMEAERIGEAMER